MDHVCNDSRVVWLRKPYPCTRMSDPANKPVKERQMIYEVIVLERPCRRDPKHEPKRDRSRKGFLP